MLGLRPRLLGAVTVLLLAAFRPNFGQTQIEVPGEFQVDPEGGASYSIGKYNVIFIRDRG